MEIMGNKDIKVINLVRLKHTCLQCATDLLNFFTITKYKLNKEYYPIFIIYILYIIINNQDIIMFLF